MSRKIALIMYYHKLNRFSVNALAGAIEIHPLLSDLEIFFPTTEKDLLETIKLHSNVYDKIIIGISICTPQIWDIQKVILEIDALDIKNLIMVAGGPHPTAEPEYTLKMGFDLIVYGEGEITFPSLVAKILNNECFAQLDGIAYFNSNNTLIKNDKPPLIDLNSYPPFSIKYNKVGHIEITRGCPFACYFCQTSTIFGNKSRHRDIPSILKYVSYLNDRGMNHIRFISPNGFLYGSDPSKKPQINYNLLEKLLNDIRSIIGKKGKIFFGTFPTEVRPENVNQQTLDLIKRYANNRNLIIGAQSGSDFILEKCHRGHSTEDVLHAIKLCKKNNIKPNVDIIFGLPYETEADILKNLKFMEKIVKLGAKIHAHTFIPLPGTVFKEKSAGCISSELRSTIETLIGNGKIYGSWEEQEIIAKKYCSEIND